MYIFKRDKNRDTYLWIQISRYARTEVDYSTYPYKIQPRFQLTCN